jgi:hypothetical protein
MKNTTMAGRSGYVMSLTVFFLFLSVLIMAITLSKSEIMLSNAQYEELGMMKASNIVRNIIELNLTTNRYGNPMGNMECNGYLRKLLDDAPLSVNLSVECEPFSPPYFRAHIAAYAPGGGYMFNTTVE